MTGEIQRDHSFRLKKRAGFEEPDAWAKKYEELLITMGPAEAIEQMQRNQAEAIRCEGRRVTAGRPDGKGLSK